MRKSTKITAVLGGVALTVATAGVAYAYWTTTGAGDGSAKAATAANSTLTLKASWAADLLVPGSSQTVSFKATNPDTQTDLRVRDITSTVTTSDAGCLPAWFTIPVVNANQTIAASGTDVPITATGTLSFLNNSATQDACKGATITLTLASN